MPTSQHLVKKGKNPESGNPGIPKNNPKNAKKQRFFLLDLGGLGVWHGRTEIVMKLVFDGVYRVKSVEHWT
eukprot:5566984-Amphidinium_carterae.1